MKLKEFFLSIIIGIIGVFIGFNLDTYSKKRHKNELVKQLLSELNYNVETLEAIKKTKKRLKSSSQNISKYLHSNFTNPDSLKQSLDRYCIDNYFRSLKLSMINVCLNEDLSTEVTECLLELKFHLEEFESVNKRQWELKQNNFYNIINCCYNIRTHELLDLNKLKVNDFKNKIHMLSYNEKYIFDKHNKLKNMHEELKNMLKNNYN